MAWILGAAFLASPAAQGAPPGTRRASVDTPSLESMSLAQLKAFQEAFRERAESLRRAGMESGDPELVRIADEGDAAMARYYRERLVARVELRTDEEHYYGRPAPAVVERIVDGDTLLLRIDLGFLVWKSQRVRLARIDAPALDDPKGYAAFEYVRDQLAKVAFVLIKTHQIDIYGRYVGHVFYAYGEADKAKVFAQGRYLNQELLDRGLAKLV